MYVANKMNYIYLCDLKNLTQWAHFIGNFASLFSMYYVLKALFCSNIKCLL